MAVYHAKAELGTIFEFNNLDGAKTCLSDWLRHSYSHYADHHENGKIQENRDRAWQELTDCLAEVKAMPDNVGAFLEVYYLSRYFKLYRLDQD